MYTFASQPDIVRANQKDEFVLSLLQERVTHSMKVIFGERTMVSIQKEISAATNLLYYLLTTAAGRQTLGEEYCDVLQVSRSSMLYPSFMNRLSLILLDAVIPYVPVFLQRLNYKKDNARWTQRLQFLIKFKDFCKSYLFPMHLGLFYFFGAYYNISKRLTGIRYITAKKHHPQNDTNGYELLGVLIACQFFINTVVYASSQLTKKSIHGSYIKNTLPEHQKCEEGKANAIANKVSLHIQCPLCLEQASDITSTPCGHLFCWDCLCEWCLGKEECPICRQRCFPREFIRIHHFDL